MHGRRVSPQRFSQLLMGGHVPQPHPRDPARGQRSAIRAEGHAGHVGTEGQAIHGQRFSQRLMRSHVPKAHGPVHACRGQRPAIRAEGYWGLRLTILRLPLKGSVNCLRAFKSAPGY